MKDERPFNQPEGGLGKLAFAFIDWMERRVRAGSRVGVGPFFEASDFPWLPALQSEWQAICADAQAVLKLRERLPAFQDISEDVAYINKDDQWKTFMLVGYGLRSARNLAACPATARALRHIPDLRTAFFSILEPGKRIPPHRGPYNGVLRLHLGLVIPQAAERCWIRVGEQRRQWSPGGVLLFDDALEHEVHNDTDEPRVVLFVDFLRPCRWPLSWLNRLLVFLARYSPLVQSARRNQSDWESRFYGEQRSGL
ncbi:MAG: aspartyl/asparaginyl beta-hydroxylase domain-containing protein [Xanthomonadales bacterium]|nr:aspartyl/asparaginyl beta-hydroxylase domain-containing protein [Xanthomonadales bacterium]